MVGNRYVAGAEISEQFGRLLEISHGPKARLIFVLCKVQRVRSVCEDRRLFRVAA